MAPKDMFEIRTLFGVKYHIEQLICLIWIWAEYMSGVSGKVFRSQTANQLVCMEFVDRIDAAIFMAWHSGGNVFHYRQLHAGSVKVSNADIVTVTFTALMEFMLHEP